jgi:hypothetical protein
MVLYDRGGFLVADNVPDRHETPNSFGSIDKLPPEIRILIFPEYIQDSGEGYDGRTPLLVKALRNRPILYQEALEIWYSLHPCCVSAKNCLEVELMPDSVLQRARELRVWYEYV